MALVDELYPPLLQEEWDSNGLICGDPDAFVSRILVGLDPVGTLVDDALDRGADFILTHHPLYLRGTNSVAANSGKGRVVHRLIVSGCALMNAHTDADSATGGVAEALATQLGFTPGAPLVPSICDGQLGIGRVCVLQEPIALRSLAEQVAERIPASPGGVLVGGDLDSEVRRVAVSGGAGDSLFDAARDAGADVFITADLRHHPASELLEDGGMGLINLTHWASEVVWCPVAARALAAGAKQRKWDVTVEFSAIITEPWSAHLQSKGVLE